MNMHYDLKTIGKNKNTSLQKKKTGMASNLELGSKNSLQSCIITSRKPSSVLLKICVAEQSMWEN